MPKPSYTTRFSYAASDVAGQLVFCFISFYLLYFYTDVYGLSAGTAGTILLAARFVFESISTGASTRPGVPLRLWATTLNPS